MENLGVEDTLRMLVSFSQAISTTIILLFTYCSLLLIMYFLFQVSDHISLDMRIQDERAEQVLKE